MLIKVEGGLCSARGVRKGVIYLLLEGGVRNLCAARGEALGGMDELGVSMRCQG